MANKIGFYTDGMTLDELITMGPEELSSLTERDMSHALRQLSLAANKRIDRLLKHLEKQGDVFVEKKNATRAIAPDALNYLNDMYKKQHDTEKGQIERFGVGNKDRNKMYAEVMRAQKFLSIKSSTIAGATEVRKNRERTATGMTREEYVKKGRTKKDKANLLEEYQARISDAYSEFRNYIQLYHPDSLNKKWEKYEHFEGSTEVLNMIASRVIEGENIPSYEELLAKEEEVYINRTMADEAALRPT